MQSNLFLYVNSYGFRALQFYPRAMAGHLSGGRRAGPGRAAAGPGQAARLLRVKNPEVQRLLGNVTPRSGWQRCLSNYTVSLFFRCSLLFVIVLRLQCFQHFLFVLCVFWLFGFVQRFLSYQAAQGFQNLEGF